MYTGGEVAILITVESLRVCPGSEEVEAAFPIAFEKGQSATEGTRAKVALPFLTPTRLSAFRILDFPTLGIPATSIVIRSSGPSSGRFASPTRDRVSDLCVLDKKGKLSNLRIALLSNRFTSPSALESVKMTSC
jgi:hypothetical protein